MTLPLNIVRILGVLAAVDLDDELSLPAEKISDIGLKWDLPAEFAAMESSTTELFPKGALCVRHRSA